jgi:hypothetical protein
MANIPGPSDSEWVRRMREIARQDAEELVPQPDFGVLGLSARSLARFTAAPSLIAKLLLTNRYD